MSAGNFTQITPEAGAKIADTVRKVLGSPDGRPDSKNPARPADRACQTDSPATLAQGNLSPDSSTWARDGSPVATAGFTLKFLTSVDWDSSAGVLSYDYRTLTFDACGRCTNASAETKVTIDTTTACS